MAKPTKTASGASSSAPSIPETPKALTVPVEGGVDITKLTPQQLANLQKQLKERKSENNGSKKERFIIIDTMLQEKNEVGEFKHTTREILTILKENNLVDVTNVDSEEIKKIQSRKQHLEKKTDEAGKLVFPPNTFGYKVSAGAFLLTADRIAGWFTAENVAKLSPESRAKIADAVK